MYEKFGVKDLLDAFESIENSSLRLLLCGSGDLNKYICELSKKDKRIIYKGQVTPEESLSWVKAADLLVNPRKDEGEYTKYSFPSKNIEYLLSGNPVLAYKLAGMSDNYKYFIFEIKSSISKAMSESLESKKDNSKFLLYANENLLVNNVLRKIVQVSR